MYFSNAALLVPLSASHLGPAECGTTEPKVTSRVLPSLWVPIIRFAFDVRGRARPGIGQYRHMVMSLC